MGKILRTKDLGKLRTRLDHSRGGSSRVARIELTAELKSRPFKTETCAEVPWQKALRPWGFLSLFKE
jgi:hypothetical protein